MRRTAGSILAKHGERDFIRKARTGDRAAFGELYKRYAPMVHGLLLARVPPDVADDLLQEVFLKAMLQLSQLRDNDHFGGWIASIARHRAINHYRNLREIQASGRFHPAPGSPFVRYHLKKGRLDHAERVARTLLEGHLYDVCAVDSPFWPFLPFWPLLKSAT